MSRTPPPPSPNQTTSKDIEWNWYSAFYILRLAGNETHRPLEELNGSEPHRRACFAHCHNLFRSRTHFQRPLVVRYVCSIRDRDRHLFWLDPSRTQRVEGFATDKFRPTLAIASAVTVTYIVAVSYSMFIGKRVFEPIDTNNGELHSRRWHSVRILLRRIWIHRRTGEAGQG